MSIADRLRFDPAKGTVIRRPPGAGYGHWVGGHKVSHDGDVFALFYRERKPLEVGRGGRCAVAISADGLAFDDVWSASKEELNASSIEVGHPVRHDDGECRLYISYEIAGTATWRIDVLRGPTFDALDTQGRRTVLNPGDYRLPWIKDPVVYRRDDGYRLFAAVPPRAEPTDSGPVRIAGALDATVVADSDDGLVFPQIEYVFEPPRGTSWHGNRARINSVFEVNGQWVATYDGGRTFYDNYEEWAGIAVSDDGVHFTRVAMDDPWVTSPHGSVRYVYGLVHGGAVYFYFEYTTEDGSHELRVSRVAL
ncbi:MAG: hypothetical protein HKO87_05430 [Acidimicrobiia bacterium]|nr:hypothetical protein [Acidimicrobiia bacterium]